MTAFEVAIVGSGPSGFFAAEALLKSELGVGVHMFDRLPTPYGLVRSGVAPDHQHIKQVVRVFDKIARHSAFAFFGNVEVGKDVSLAALRARYDAVILAQGVSDGTALDVPGSKLPQSMTATEFVNWYNGHPDYRDAGPLLDHETAVIVGHGNVAIDVARILLSDHDRLSKTDIADHALEALHKSKVRRVHLVGRRGPAQASFTTAELRELVLGMKDVRTRIDPHVLDFEAEDVAFIARPVNAVVQRNIGVLREAAARSGNDDDTRELELSFLASPTAVRGNQRVQSVGFVKNTLQGPAEDRRAVATKETYSISTGLVISCIGFRGRPIEGVPLDDRRGVCRHVAGRITGAEMEGLAPLYAAGWIKRGANGVIGTNRADAVETVRSVVEDLGSRQVRPSRFPTLPILLSKPVDFAGWDRIDAAERAAGVPEGRPRRKIVDIDAMLAVASAGAESDAGVDAAAADGPGQGLAALSKA